MDDNKEDVQPPCQLDLGPGLAADEPRQSVLRLPDRGYAWTFLGAAFMVEALAFGYAFSVGILHDYWVTKLFPQSGQATILAFAATLQAGLLPCMMPLVSPIYARWPHLRLGFQLGGVVLAGCGILTTGYVTQPWQLVLSLGVAYGLGGALFYQPATALLFDWFDAKRGLAAGVMYSASGIGGTVFPFLTQALLNRYSYKTTLIGSAVGYTVVGCAASGLIRPRTSPSPNAISTPATLTWSKLLRVSKSYPFWAISLSTLTFALAMVVPTVYLPLFASAIGLSDEMGVILVAVLNASSAAGMVTMGFFTDRQPLYRMIPVSTIGAACATLLLWGFSTRLAVVIPFSILFGFFGVGYLAFAPKMVTILAPNDVELSSHLISVVFALTGVGNIVSGPIATALQEHSFAHAKYAYGLPGYGPLIVYTAAMLVLSAAFGFSLAPL